MQQGIIDTLSTGHKIWRDWTRFEPYSVWNLCEWCVMHEINKLLANTPLWNDTCTETPVWETLVHTASYISPLHRLILLSPDFGNFHYPWNSRVSPTTPKSRTKTAREIAAADNETIQQVPPTHRTPGRAWCPPGRGRTPLWWAAEKCHVEVVELLLRSDASAEVADDKGQSPRAEER